MIFIAGTLSIDPAQLSAFETGVAAMRDRCLQEDGCNHYSLLAQDRANGVINVLEMWRDDAALKVHFTQPWVVEFFGKFGPHVTGSTLQVYDIAGGPRPLPPM